MFSSAPLAIISSLLAGSVAAETSSNARAVYQFEDGTWVENLALRPNGNLLVTRVDQPEVYEIDPSSSGVAPKLIHNFAGYTSVFGISEVSSDVFAVVTGNFSLSTFATEAASFGVWQVDLSGRSNTTASQITDIPEGVFLNGMTTLSSSAVLVSDSSAGVVYRVDTQTGAYNIVLDDDTMDAPANASLQIGVNGIRYRNGYLYYQNLFGKLFCRVPIDAATGEATGAYEVVAENAYADDFALDAQGVAYAANGFENEILKISPDGDVEIFAGALDSTLFAGATSAQFGANPSILYVTTGGGLAAPINGTYTEGAKIMALSL